MKHYHPSTPSRRHMSGINYRTLLTKARPHKPLTGGFARGTGHDSAGRVSVRHKGGGHKRRYRAVDFSYNKTNIPARVESVEYDPNRSGFIGLICYRDGERRYALLPQGVVVGDELMAAANAPIKPGNRLPLGALPAGTAVFNIEVQPGGGARLVRSAGSSAIIEALSGGYVNIKLPSGEVRKISERSWATIGAVSNEENKLVNIGKAGRSRWRGIRPTVRGSAMNPVDHPYGGGEGRQGRGTRRAKTRWGKPSGKGQKTRRAKKYSNKFIVSRRPVGKRKKTQG